jgi:type IV secretory pathway VirB4 component
MAIEIKKKPAIDTKKLMKGGVGYQSKSSMEMKKEEALEKVALEEERVYRKGVASIKDLIAPASFKVEPSYVRLGDVYARTLFIVTYPRYVSVGWASPLINLSTQLDIAMFFYPIKADVILKELKRKVGILEAQITMDAEAGKARDPQAEVALRDIEQLRDDLTQGIEHFFQFGFYCTFYSRSTDELERLSRQVESTFGSMLIYTKSAFYQAEQGFNSTLPLGNDELMITFNMSTSPIASSFPFTSAELTSDNGILYGVNRHNNSLIIFDRFSLQNANAVVFAMAGSGKSYAVKLEIIRSLMLGTEVIVIDPEMEYKHLSEAVGGTYINISLASNAKINPFDLPRPIGESVSTEDVIRSAVIILKGLLRLMLGKLTSQEDSILDRALLETYAKKDIVPGADLTKIEPPILQDFQDILEGMEGTSDLVIRLKKFSEGTFSGLLNSPTTVNMNNTLVVFSVRDLEDELRPMAIYTIINYIWNVVRSERKKRILVIDEAWWLMQAEDSAKFIFALVKRCRKYYMGVTTITQDVNDFLTSPYGQAIVTNSSIQLLLKQSPASIDLIGKTFLLTQSEKYLLLESGKGEGIFFAGQKHAAIQVVASYSEDQIVTTDPKQLMQIEQAKKDFDQTNTASQDGPPSPGDVGIG